ncbi:MAG: hypothetical protein ABSE42_13135 [Bryobacteraceae bacterium]|jgi:hypothetical protein
MRWLSTVLALALATAASADVITLKSGRVINGTYLGGTAHQVKIEAAGTVETIDVADIYRIEFSGNAPAPVDPDRPALRRAPDAAADSDRPTLRRAPGAAADSDRPTLRRAPDAAADSGQPTLQRAPGADADSSPPTPRRSDSGNTVAILKPGEEPSVSSRPSAAPAPLILPEGTNFAVRMIDAVDSDKVTVGQNYSAALDEPVVIDGQTAIPRGADVVVKLVNAKDSGKFSGKAELTLALWTVKVNGKVVDVNTQTITRESESRGQRTGAMAAGGAIVGAVIGGIAGGGKGAAIGAGAGGAAGVGAEAATKGPRVKIPAETRLTFVLDNAVSI